MLTEPVILQRDLADGAHGYAMYTLRGCRGMAGRQTERDTDKLMERLLNEIDSLIPAETEYEDNVGTWSGDIDPGDDGDWLDATANATLNIEDLTFNLDPSREFKYSLLRGENVAKVVRQQCSRGAACHYRTFYPHVVDRESRLQLSGPVMLSYDVERLVTRTVHLPTSLSKVEAIKTALEELLRPEVVVERICVVCLLIRP